MQPLWKNWSHQIFSVLITHLDWKKRILGSYPREKGESNNNASVNTVTYHIQNASRNLFPIGDGSTFLPASARNFKSSKMKLIKLAMKQCRTCNYSKDNTIWHQTVMETSLHSRVQIYHWIIYVLLVKNGIIYWK